MIAIIKLDREIQLFINIRVQLNPSLLNGENRR
jgi:hypothetical protein